LPAKGPSAGFVSDLIRPAKLEGVQEMAFVIEKKGFETGTTKEVNERLTIGRDPSNQLQLLDNKVSRRHAQIVDEGGSFVIEDLGSKNGTFVNGILINKRQALKDSDEIKLGDTVLLFRQSAEGEFEPFKVISQDTEKKTITTSFLEPKECSQCSIRLEPGWKFCPKCGNKIE
jgi:pSer/pThr/pTyr-binding forkhead associated (FHA) protein